MRSLTEQLLAASLPPAERITPEVAQRVEELANVRKWREIKQLLLAVPREELSRHPRVMFVLADAFGRLGFVERAVELAQEASDRFAAQGDQEQWLLARKRVGAYVAERGMLDQAEAILSEVIAAAEPLGMLEVMGGVLNNLGAIAGMRGARDEAFRYYERALAAGQKAGDEQGLARTYYNLALAYRDSDLFMEADALFLEAGRRARAIGDEWLAQIAGTARAELELRRKGWSPPELDAAWRQAMVRFDVFASTLGQAEAQKLAGMVAASRGDHAAAARRFSDAIDLAAAHGNPLLAAEARMERAESRLKLGELAHARTDFADAAVLFAELGNDEAAGRARDRVALIPPDTLSPSTPPAGHG
ncbi:MAG TPA: tetratricopeptide repeat protein [Gemmatimonadaceae bacterium]|nr:tetratricopeptide repeat protein [Gemmatimonadaceae bacterium]